jgi:hypothetical protein
MLYDGKSAASPTTTRLLSPAKWASIKSLLGLPDHARDDFEKVVQSVYGNATLFGVLSIALSALQASAPIMGKMATSAH